MNLYIKLKKKAAIIVVIFFQNRPFFGDFGRAQFVKKCFRGVEYKQYGVSSQSCSSLKDATAYALLAFGILNAMATKTDDTELRNSLTRNAEYAPLMI